MASYRHLRQELRLPAVHLLRTALYHQVVLLSAALLSTDLTLAMPQYVERAVKEAPCNLATWRRRERSTLNRYGPLQASLVPSVYNS